MSDVNIGVNKHASATARSNVWANVSANVGRFAYKRALTNGKPGNSGENSNGTVHPGGNFPEKKEYFRGITFFGFLPKHPTFFEPFAWLTSARLGTLKKYRRGGKTNPNYKTIDPTEILLPGPSRRLAPVLKCRRSPAPWFFQISSLLGIYRWLWYIAGSLKS